MEKNTDAIRRARETEARHEEEKASTKKRGDAGKKKKKELRARGDAVKTKITIRLGDDMIEAFRRRAGAGSYQALIRRALREWLWAKEARGLLGASIERIEKAADKLETAAEAAQST